MRTIQIKIMLCISYSSNFLKQKQRGSQIKYQTNYRRYNSHRLVITCKKKPLTLDKRAPKPLDPRLVALKQLMRIDTGLLASDEVLDSPLMDFIPKVEIKDYKIYPERIKIKRKFALKSSGGEQKLSPEGQLYVQEVVSGVTRWRMRLDDIIMAYLKKASLKDLDVVVLNSLRLGIFEVLERDLPALDINKVISLPRAFELPRQARSTINSVLRKITVNYLAGDIVLQHDFLGGKETFKGGDFAAGLSHPSWLVKRWLRRYGGQEGIRLMLQNNANPKYSIRFQAEKNKEVLKKLEDIRCKVEEGEFLKDEFVTIQDGLLNLLSSELLQKGDVYLQDISSGLAVNLLDPQPGERIADACCTPGEKTIHIAQKMKGQGQIVAIDFDSQALQTLQQKVKDQKLSNVISTYEQDIRNIGASTKLQDKVEEENNELDIESSDDEEEQSDRENGDEFLILICLYINFENFMD
eukprot:TRINITY_DN21368_c0_g1_i15.p1 TRINITY_DN21368_c0_g1~~TRINITY_DN21368_c0_g1_i15.p1  ORF type:complete len:467 (+),score=59.91 TRINITY_DN21368_c0_g1_i15:66-1466(+)